MPSRTAGGSGTTYTAEDQANELLGEPVMPPPSVASGYAPLPAPVPATVQPAPATAVASEQYYGGAPAPTAYESTVAPAPSLLPSPTPASPAMDRRVGATANNPQDGAFLIQNMYGTPAPAYNNAALDAMERPQASSQQYNNAALDAMERPQASSQQYNFDAAEPYGLGPRAIPAQGNRLASQQAYGPPVNSNELAPPAPTIMPSPRADITGIGRQDQTPTPTPIQDDPAWDFLDYIVPAAAEAERTPERTGPLIENPAREFATPAPVRQAGTWRPEGLWDMAAPAPSVIQPSSAPPYPPSATMTAEQAGLNTPLAGVSFENPMGGAAQMTQRELDALGLGVTSVPNATTLNYEVARRTQAASEIERQRQAASAQTDPLIDAAIAQSDAGIQDAASPSPSVMDLTTQAQQQADMWNRFDPFNQTRQPGDSVGAPVGNGLAGTIGQSIGGTSAGVTPPATGGLAGNVPAKTILNPDGTLVARDAAFSSGELFPDDTFIADDGTEGRMGTFYVADDESGSLIPVTPAPGTTQAIKEAGGDIWTLDDTEFDTLVEAGLVDEADREAMVGRPMAIGKEWVDALGGNVTYETVAAAPAVDTSAAGGGGGNTRSSGSRSSYGSRSYGGGGGGNYGGGFAGDIAAFFGPDFMGGWFAADGGNGREGTPFESPIFDRYFATRDGRRLTRRRRSRRRSMRRGSAQMPDMNKTMRRGGGDTASSNLDRARQLQERT